MTTKRCKNCGELLELSSFRSWVENRRGKTETRVSPRCIDCDREKDKEKTKRRDKSKVKKAGEKYREATRLKKIEQENPKSTVFFRICKDCGKKEVLSKEPQGIGKHYCRSHQQRYKILGKRFSCAEKEVICRKCGVVHIGKQSNSLCSSCSNEAASKSKRKHRKLRKAKERGAKTGIAFDHIDVFKRDKWKCKMCGCKVQKKDIYANNAAELDHIIPISKGGLHVPSNVQTLCRYCNNKKSNKTIGQISLFGRMVL